MQKIIHHIKKVRQQPEQTRRHLSHVLVVVCGIVLALLWIYSLGARSKAAGGEIKANNGPAPLELFSNILK